MKRMEAAIEKGLPLKPLWTRSMRVEKRSRRKGGRRENRRAGRVRKGVIHR